MIHPPWAAGRPFKKVGGAKPLAPRIFKGFPGRPGRPRPRKIQDFTFLIWPLVVGAIGLTLCQVAGRSSTPSIARKRPAAATPEVNATSLAATAPVATPAAAPTVVTRPSPRPPPVPTTPPRKKGRIANLEDAMGLPP